MVQYVVLTASAHTKAMAHNVSHCEGVFRCHEKKECAKCHLSKFTCRFFGINSHGQQVKSCCDHCRKRARAYKQQRTAGAATTSISATTVDSNVEVHTNAEVRMLLQFTAPPTKLAAVDTAARAVGKDDLDREQSGTVDRDRGTNVLKGGGCSAHDPLSTSNIRLDIGGDGAGNVADPTIPAELINIINQCIKAKSYVVVHTMVLRLICCTDDMFYFVRRLMRALTLVCMCALILPLQQHGDRGTSATVRPTSWKVQDRIFWARLDGANHPYQYNLANVVWLEPRE